MGKGRIEPTAGNSEKILSLFETFLRERELSENTIDTYKTSIREYFESQPIVSKQNSIIWKKELLNHGKSCKTVNVRINAYNALCEMLHCEKDKCKTIKVHQETTVSNVISEADYKKLLQRLKEDENWKWYFGIKLLATTGARVSEYIRLQKKDFDRGYAEMWTKGKIRRIYIPKSFRDESSEYYSNLAPDDFLMPNRHGEQITTRGVSGMLQKFAVKYGINKKCMHPHSFRHLYAIEFLNRNNNLSLLADLMGHSSVATTAIYTRMTKEQQQAALDNAVNW